MTNAERVILAFFHSGEARQATIQPIRVKLVSPSGENLMAIRLVPDVPHKLVVWGIEYVVKCDGEFDYSQTGAKMASIDRNIIDNELAKFFAKLH
jgi:hypothetical protein